MVTSCHRKVLGSKPPSLQILAEFLLKKNKNNFSNVLTETDIVLYFDAFTIFISNRLLEGCEFGGSKLQLHSCFRQECLKQGPVGLNHLELRHLWLIQLQLKVKIHSLAHPDLNTPSMLLLLPPVC